LEIRVTFRGVNCMYFDTSNYEYLVLDTKDNSANQIDSLYKLND